MVRTRLAAATLAGGLLLSSGCNGLERFHSWHNGKSECPCYDATGAVYGGSPVGLEHGAGPHLTAPAGTMVAPPPQLPPQFAPQFAPPVPQGAPLGPAPRIVPIPATPMPWTGQ